MKTVCNLWCYRSLSAAKLSDTNAFLSNNLILLGLNAAHTIKVKKTSSISLKLLISRACYILLAMDTAFRKN